MTTLKSVLCKRRQSGILFASSLCHENETLGPLKKVTMATKILLDISVLIPCRDVDIDMVT